MKMEWNWIFKIFLRDRIRIKELEKKLKGWTPYPGWKKYVAPHTNIGNVNVQPNTFICINDWEFKAKIMRWRVHDYELIQAYIRLAEKIDDHVNYLYDWMNKLYDGNIESWQHSSITFKLRSGDCEDHANMYQAGMHMLGYGKICRCVRGDMYWKSNPDKPEHHVWNQVLIDGVWVDIDPTNYRSKHLIDRYDKPIYFWNYYGTYKK